jgi:hypothetical protein
MAIREKAGPDTPSCDYEAMLPYWTRAQTILDGLDAMRAAGETMLPRFPEETVAIWERRNANSVLTNIFSDIVQGLAAKPFAQECRLAGESPPARMVELAEDIDGHGNSMHVFAGNMFYNGIAKAVDWVLVDYPKVAPGATQAQERAANARPYWVRVPAENLIAVYSDMVDGEEQIVHARILECSTERVGWEEAEVVRVRVLDRELIETEDEATGAISRSYGPATFTVYERRERLFKGQTRISWVIVDEGILTIGVIPLVPFLTGRRKPGSWRVLPPMQVAVDLQVELYQQESNLKCAKERSCFPMLKALGVKAPQKGEEPIKTGPYAVLYAPNDEEGNHGDFGVVEPGAQSLKFLADENKEIGRQLRELGRQPLTAQTGNLTVVTTAFAAQKGNSAVQAWALNLKDALERAWQYTCLWLNEQTEVEVYVYTDFDVENQDGASMERIIKMRASGDISRETLWTEAKRRNELSAEFDAEKEKERLAEEAPDPDTEEDRAAAGQGLRLAA